MDRFEWKGDKCYVGEKYIGMLCRYAERWYGSSEYGYNKDKFQSPTEARAAVEQAFTEWMEKAGLVWKEGNSK